VTVDGDLLEVCRNQDRQPDELMKPTSVNEDTRQPTSFRSYINLFATTPCRGLSLSRWMVKPHQFRVGDLVKFCRFRRIYTTQQELARLSCSNES
jgi:hypothetical protein